MKTRMLNPILPALWMATALVLSSCSDATGPVAGGAPPEEESPGTFPPIPHPAAPDEIIPDESEVYTAIVPIAGKNLDFAPAWTAGVFTWDVDIQTQYKKCLPTCEWYGDAPGDYVDGTAHNSELVYEGGVVNLTSPDIIYIPRRVLFIQGGTTVATPRNPERNSLDFRYMGDNGTKRYDPALFFGAVHLAVDPGFLETERRREYYVVATACPLLTNSVYLKRDRYWKRLRLGGDGNNLKSIRVDPGSTFEVSYTRTQGTSYSQSQTLTHTLSGEVSLADPSEVVGAKLGKSLSEAFETSIVLTEESSVTVTRTMTGIEGKTVIYSVWTSVEHYEVVDRDGNPYTDPNFTFKLGSTDIQGEYEWISSTAFDYE